MFPFCLSSFFNWDMFFIYLCWLLPCVCFQVFGRAPTSPSLGGASLCSRCPVGPSGTASLDTREGWSRGIAPHTHWCGLCACSYYSWAVTAVSISVRKINPQAHHLWGLTETIVEELQGPTPRSRTLFSGALVPAESTSWVCCSWRRLGGASMWSEAV